ncbi:MAG: GNAT family N-acetyltransferase [Promethearchaeota archaeon]
MFEIVELDESIEKRFWDYVLRDIPRYFFFILDLKIYPERCKFLIALDDGIIVGICLIWSNHIAQVRSEDPDVIEALYNAIPEEIPIDEVTFEEPHKDLLLKLIPNPKKKIAMHRMRMVLNEEKMIPRYKLEKPYTQRKLDSDDLDEIVELMRISDPVFWGDITGDKYQFDETQFFYGLFDEEKLISYTLSWIDDTAAIVSTVATHPDYQNQGLATYLVNEAVHKLVEHTDIGLIHVRVDNPPAIKVYTKVGYEVYMTYLNVRL